VRKFDPGEHEREHGGGQREPGELVGADPADDGGVDQDVERLDGERAEGGEREPQDPPVGGVEPEPGGSGRSGGEQADGRIRPLERGRRDGSGLAGAGAQEAGELGPVVEQLA
jgi:hypothetical protein